MFDKKHDSFFDEETPDDRKSEELLKMIASGAGGAGGVKRVQEFAEGEKVSGPVSRVGSEYLYVDIGAKNEALMKVSEVAGAKAGDTVSGFIVSQVNGETIISKSLGGRSASVSVLQEALESKVPVQGKVTGVAKAGLNVKILGHKAFCPVSQIDVKFTSDVNEYLGKNLDFVITRITEGGKNIVVSRIPLFEAGMEEEFAKLAKAVDSKTPMKGKITKIAEFGLFVQIGSLEGLVHISEVSWERAQKLQDSFTVGQEVEFVVLKVERKNPLRNSKISLSIKQALEDPWTKVLSSVSVGQAIDGKVTRLADFGAFVEVLPGVDGLVHVSEMAWGKRVHHPSEVVQAGQAVKVTVLGIDQNKRSISLTLKDVDSDPWKDVADTFKVGAEVPGTVAKRAKFGYFVDLAEGVTGLLVFARIVADKKESLKPGDKVTVMIDSIDTEARRIGLSMGVGELKKESEEAKQILKKLDAAKAEKKADSSSTEFGAALMAALKIKAPAVVPAATPMAVAKDVKVESVKAEDVKVSDTEEYVKTKDVKIGSAKVEDVKVKDVKNNDVKTEDVKAKDVKIGDAKAEDAKVKDVKVSDTKADDAKAKDVKIRDAKAENVKIKDVKTEDIKAKDEKASDVKVASIKIKDAEISDTKVDGVKAKGAKISDVKIEDAKAKDVKIKDAKIDDIKIKDAGIKK